MTLRDVHPELFVLVGYARKAAKENGVDTDAWTADQFATDLQACDADIAGVPHDLLVAVILEMRSERLQ